VTARLEDALDPEKIQSLRKEIWAFAHRPTDSLELVPLYEACHTEKGRCGRIRKGPFVFFWLLTKVDERGLLRQFLQREADEARKRAQGLPPGRSVLRTSPKKIQALRDLLRLLYPNPKSTLGLYAFPDLDDDLEAAISSFEKNGKAARFLMNLLAIDDDGAMRIKERSSLADQLEDLPTSSLPMGFVDFLIDDVMKMDPGDQDGIQLRLKKIERENKLFKKVFEFLKARQKAGGSRIPQRELERKFHKKISALSPHLGMLAEERIILWDLETKTVSLNGYDQADQRSFTWLAGSSWPRSPFEPYLETGKVYLVRDFRVYVVEEWIRTAAAEFC